jgi:hypothetical protein
MRRLTFAFAAALLVVCAANARAQDASGTWDSELGPVTIEKQGPKVTGSWTTRAGQRGTIVEGTQEGASLGFSYTWPVTNEKGYATFRWNPDSQRWEGNWRHTAGAMGGWNLMRAAGSAAGTAAPASSAPWTLLDVSVQPASVRPGSTFELLLKYQVTATSATLDESRRLVASDGTVKGTWQDRKQLGPGIHTSTRKVTASASTKPGSYEFKAELKEGTRVETKSVTITVTQ